MKAYDVDGHLIIKYEDKEKDYRFALFLFVCFMTIPVSLPLLYMPKIGNWLIQKVERWIEG